MSHHKPRLIGFRSPEQICYKLISSGLMIAKCTLSPLYMFTHQQSAEPRSKQCEIHAILTPFHSRLTAPTTMQETDQLFSLSPAQYNRMTDPGHASPSRDAAVRSNETRLLLAHCNKVATIRRGSHLGLSVSSFLGSLSPELAFFDSFLSGSSYAASLFA